MTSSFPTTTPDPSDLGGWHRVPCPVLDAEGMHSGVIVCGDLHSDERRAADQLDEWAGFGTTVIIDCRDEWSDERFVTRRHPEIAYVHVGVDDHGGQQPDEWFDQGVDGAVAQISAGGRALVHCHMGINRGPSMALAVLLALGWDVVAALDALLRARPIVGLLYAADAIDWFGRREGWSTADIADSQAAATDWLERNGIDHAHVARVIRAVRVTGE